MHGKLHKKLHKIPFLALGADPSSSLFVSSFVHPVGLILRIYYEMCDTPGRKPLEESLAMIVWFNDFDIVGGQPARGFVTQANCNNVFGSPIVTVIKWNYIPLLLHLLNLFLDSLWLYQLRKRYLNVSLRELKWRWLWKLVLGKFLTAGRSQRLKPE